MTKHSLRDIIRTEIGTKESQFGVQMIRRVFATYIIKEHETNPRQFKQYAAKMGTSVDMLMSNYAQVPDNDDQDEHQGLGSLFEEEEEKVKKNKKREYQRSDEYKETRNKRSKNSFLFFLCV